MRVMAQMAMVMNLDKCIGCHTCSVTCKQAWTNRTGVEYVWFNNVETRPGQGYPRRYEDQETWRGGWTLNRRGRLALKGGGRFRKLLTIFSNPKLPAISDYYEPWTYDYETLTNAPLQEHTPVARPKSLISGENMKISWSANWDDDLGGSPDHGDKDVLLKNIADKVKFEFEQTFMFYLPRICEHCLNPSCAASCPWSRSRSTTGDSGGMYQTIGMVRYSGCSGSATSYFMIRSQIGERCAAVIQSSGMPAARAAVTTWGSCGSRNTDFWAAYRSVSASVAAADSTRSAS